MEEEYMSDKEYAEYLEACEKCCAECCLESGCFDTMCSELCVCDCYCEDVDCEEEWGE